MTAQNGTGVDAARQITGDRHVGLQPQLHRLQQLLAHALDVICFLALVLALGIQREIHVPVLRARAPETCHARVR